MNDDDLKELFDFLKVKNLKDAKQSISGLRERVKFTEDYEAVLLKCSRLAVALLELRDGHESDYRWQVPEELQQRIKTLLGEV